MKTTYEKIVLKTKDKFTKVFGLNLIDYFSPLTGFDLIAFDEKI